VSVVLYRVDERLIHGQVIVGWGARLRPQRIVVVDDDLATSPWEQDLYAMGVPDETAAEFVAVDAAIEQLPAWQESPERVMVLTRDIATMSRTAGTGLLAGEEINIGGIHHAPGRRKVLRYVYLSDEERQELRALSEHGVRVTARDLPGARPVHLDELVGAG
jgi:mannose/fructose/N-acetylgalactosamine-specific phosphotransferase system component IIB